MTATLPDLIRLTVPVAFAGAAVHDYHSRRVASDTWPPLAALGVALIVLDIYHALTTPGASAIAYAAGVGVSVAVVGGLGVGLFAAGAFGAADMKALLVLSILLPTTPEFATPLGTLPVAAPPLGILSLAVVSNALVLVCAYPVVLGVRNLLAGHVTWRMFVARPTSPAELSDRYGQVQGLDLDVFRSYLDWSDTTAEEIGHVDEEQATEFLDELDGPRYGATAADVQRGLKVIADNREVWVTPGVPFLVPIFAGVVTAFTVGDLLALLG